MHVRVHVSVLDCCACYAIDQNIARVFVTVPEKTDHFMQISDIDIVVPCYSALLTLHNGEVRITIAYIILE